MAYSTFKFLHVCLAATVFGIHCLTGLWLMADYPKAERSWMTALYSSLIALLIVSGVWLSAELKNHSIKSPWITATIWDTAIFLCLAFIAFRCGPTKTIRVVAWFASVLTLLQIAVTDMLKDALGIIAIRQFIHSLS